MNRSELARVLELFEIRPYSYDLFWRGDSDEVYAISHEGKSWAVFYAERGLRSSERTFLTEADACDEVLRRIAEDPLTRSV